MISGEERKVPVKEGLWTIPSSPDEKPCLIAKRCPSCGEIYFPGKPMCIHCGYKDLEQIKLGRRGRIYSVTVVMQRPPRYYQGPVPYAIGYVELPDGVRIETLFTGCDPDDLKIGMDVELVIEKLHEDEDGNEIMAYKFRPISENVSAKAGGSSQ